MDENKRELINLLISIEEGTATKEELLELTHLLGDEEMLDYYIEITSLLSQLRDNEFKIEMYDEAGSRIPDCGYKCVNITITEEDCCLCVFGDCNCNCEIDIFDLDTFAQAFGKSSGEPGYHRCVDYNGNGRIDVADLDAFAQNFGRINCDCDTCCAPWCSCESCPPPWQQWP